MKITKEQLKQIIKEELVAVLTEADGDPIVQVHPNGLEFSNIGPDYKNFEVPISMLAADSQEIIDSAAEKEGRVLIRDIDGAAEFFEELVDGVTKDEIGAARIEKGFYKE
jgi:hypothetical protein